MEIHKKAQSEDTNEKGKYISISILSVAVMEATTYITFSFT